MPARGAKSNAPIRVWWRREFEHARHRLDPVFAPITIKLATGIFGSRKYEWLRFIPHPPRWLIGWAKPPVWPDPEEVNTPTPPELQSWSGTIRDPEREEEAYRERPIYNFTAVHMESVMWTLARAWAFLLPTFPRLSGAVRRCMIVAGQKPTAAPRDIAPAELSRMIRAKAKELGISEIGFAKADVKYTFHGFADPGDQNIIVCILEQDYKATQTAPSVRAEKAAFRAYGEMFPNIAKLAQYVQDLGYDARPNDYATLEGIGIHYGIEAGLGQLGQNGQLLTPMAGSRARLGLITTNAPMELGQPIDHGIPRVCDECQICVRRCPPGAIPIARKDKRGVMKASIKPERCFPTMAQTHGCAVCIKVCPIQRYGLAAVKEHFAATGEILGKGTDDLEGYVWPLDGRFYGSGEKPPINAKVLSPEGWPFDKDRVTPPGVELPMAGADALAGTSAEH